MAAMSNKKFQRTIEDFTCGHCGAAVTGNGYTNHCPHCLYSCHVDVNPGDRAESCGGLMMPIGLEQKGLDWVVIQQCKKCKMTRRCKTVPEDSDGILQLAKKIADFKTR